MIYLKSQKAGSYIFLMMRFGVLQLEEVLKFVKENAQSLLSVEEASVYPVSARRALLAKQAAVNEDGVVDRELLMQNSSWKSSGFDELEDFIFCFLGGSTDAGAERLRLKLETPLGIGMALLGASDRQLAADILKAESDLRVLAQIEEQLKQYENAVQADAALQRERTSLLVRAEPDFLHLHLWCILIMWLAVPFHVVSNLFS